MPSNPLSVFYSVPRWEFTSSGYIQISWRCDPDAIPAISRAGNFDLAGISIANLQAVNAHLDQLISSDPGLTTVVVTNLYRVASSQQNLIRHNCWFNFIAAMTVKAALHSWQKIPKSQQSEDLFERLITPTLSIKQLLTRFDPTYQPNLLVGLQAWTYNAVRYNSFSYLRANGDPYFGLSNFGVVSRSSWSETCEALSGNLTTEQIKSYKSISKIFKDYLSQARIRVDRLELNHWQKVVDELSLRSINLSIDQLREHIDRIGYLIRAARSPIVKKYDDPSLLPIINSQTTYSESDIEELDETFGQIFAVVDQFFQKLASEDRQIIILRHHQKLTQQKIAQLTTQDQSQVSRQLGKIYFNLLDCLHSQIPTPDGVSICKNSQAIAAAKHLFARYFQQDYAADIST
jgi:RNA polymerase sigma factor (sigma-70 family)